MTINKRNLNEFVKPAIKAANDAKEELGDYLLSNSVSDRAKKSGQLGQYYKRGLEAALAKRASSLYGSRGAVRGAQGLGLAGAVAAQFMGKKGKTKKITAAKVAGKGLAGGVLGSIIGAGIGTYDPETGMAVAPGAAVFALAGLGRRAFSRSVTGKSPRTGKPFSSPLQAAQGVGGSRSRAAYARRQQRLSGLQAAGPGRRQKAATEISQKSSAKYAGAAGSIAAVLAGKFYGYHSDRFEKAKQGQTDPYLGRVTSSPGIPGYNR